MFEKQQEGHCGKRGNATEDEELEVTGGGGESTGLSGLWLLQSVKGHASPRLSLKNTIKWRAQIMIIQYDAIPINFATYKTIPYPVLKVLKVQTKLWELGWEVKNQESQGGLVSSIQTVITDTTDWGACEQQKSHFSLPEAETAKRETPADCLLRTYFLEGTFLLHVLTWGKGYGSPWGLLFIYLFFWGEPDSSA